MKTADHQSAWKGRVYEQPVYDVSLETPFPPELIQRFSEAMGLDDCPEHPFRMYATAALG